MWQMVVGALSVIRRAKETGSTRRAWLVALMARRVASPASELYLVYFDFDKFEFSEAAKAVLETASSAGRKLKGMTVTVSGHTDLAGTADYNMELSKRRAMAVSEALIKAGVASVAVKAESFGQTHVAEAGNRRVEILIGVKEL